MKRSYEELRDLFLEVFTKENNRQLQDFHNVVFRIDNLIGEKEQKQPKFTTTNRDSKYLDREDENTLLEIYWEFVNQGIIMPALDDRNSGFPWLRLTKRGEKYLEGDRLFVRDISSFQSYLQEQLPEIQETTLIYLTEAMNAFRSECMLSAAIMIGVATEGLFEDLLKIINANEKYKRRFKKAVTERTLLRKFNAFKKSLETIKEDLPFSINEDLDTNLNSILSAIRATRNESGHPTGKIPHREQVYVHLQLFVYFAKKITQLEDFFKIDSSCRSECN